MLRQFFGRFLAEVLLQFRSEVLFIDAIAFQVVSQQANLRYGRCALLS